MNDIISSVNSITRDSASACRWMYSITWLYNGIIPGWDPVYEIWKLLIATAMAEIHDCQCRSIWTDKTSRYATTRESKRKMYCESNRKYASQSSAVISHSNEIRVTKASTHDSNNSVLQGRSCRHRSSLCPICRHIISQDLFSSSSATRQLKFINPEFVFSGWSSVTIHWARRYRPVHVRELTLALILGNFAAKKWQAKLLKIQRIFLTTLQPAMEEHREPKLDVESSPPGVIWRDGDDPSEPSIAPDEAKREQKLIRKMDFYILPFVVMLYLFSFLDRGMFLIIWRSTIY